MRRRKEVFSSPSSSPSLFFFFFSVTPSDSTTVASPSDPPEPGRPRSLHPAPPAAPLAGDRRRPSLGAGPQAGPAGAADEQGDLLHATQGGLLELEPEDRGGVGSLGGGGG